jgi:hypothetical protein
MPLTVTPFKPDIAMWEPLGRYIFDFGRVEDDIDWALTTLNSLPRGQGKIIFGEITNMPTKIRMFNHFCKKATEDPTRLAALDKIVDHLDIHRQFRYSLVHGGWGTWNSKPDGGGFYTKFEISRTYKLKTFDASPSSINAMQKHLLPLRVMISQFVKSLTDEKDRPFEPPPLPDKLPWPSDD